jgi:hypothetical protein
MPSIKLEDALLEQADDEAIETEVYNLAVWGTDDPKVVKAREEEMHKELMRDLALEASFDDFTEMCVESTYDDFDPFDD